ncbi:helix-turn-helix domain-containing protein [Wohlfahrtiimonas populi]|nr:helix-turn-helix domain-containing protein [Wohlfahrtiimonas populi]
MFISRTLTKHSLPEIGRAFERDHSTVMHACRKIEDDLKTDYVLQRDYETIKATLTH